MEGFLLINKPAEITSFGCLGHLRHLLGKGVKVGYAGTLDKFATGLLIVGIGRGATKHLGRLLKMPKTYFGTGKLGELTDTYDPAGVICEKNLILVTQQQLQLALSSFGNGYIQVPPVYSALKFQGQRLSDLHRTKKDSAIDVREIAFIKRRFVYLYELQLDSFVFPYFKIKAHVSSGTYIRVLVNDIAKKLDTCAMTVQLCRTAIGPFKLTNALDLGALNLELIKQKMLTINEMQSQLDLGSLIG